MGYGRGGRRVREWKDAVVGERHRPKVSARATVKVEWISEGMRMSGAGSSGAQSEGNSRNRQGNGALDWKCRAASNRFPTVIHRFENKFQSVRHIYMTILRPNCLSNECGKLFWQAFAMNSEHF